MAYWPLNEGGGTTTADASGNENHGTFIGNPVWDSGKPGAALKFDGTDDAVDCGNPPILDFGTGDFTVSAWIIVIESSDTTIFANGADHGGGTRYQMMFENGSGGVIDCVFDNDSGKKDPEGDIVVFDGKWHHIVMMRRDGIHIRLYVDGVEDTGVTNHGDATIAADYDLSRTDEHNAYIGAVWHDDKRYNRKLWMDE